MFPSEAEVLGDGLRGGQGGGIRVVGDLEERRGERRQDLLRGSEGVQVGAEVEEVARLPAEETGVEVALATVRRGCRQGQGHHLQAKPNRMKSSVRTVRAP
jgi:hypothetical protein